MSLIHKFKKRGIPIVLDVNSGAVHVVDRLVFDLLDYYPAYDKKAIEAEMKDKYNPLQIAEGLGEITQLERQGLLFSDDHYREFAVMDADGGVVKALCLHIAHDCNMRCGYCFASQGSFNCGKALMNTDVAQRAIDFLIENSGGRKNIEIDFFGGEPLLNFGVVKEAVEYGKDKAIKAGKSIKFAITTNALLLDDEINAFINENMYNVVLSMDGRKEIHNRMRPDMGGRATYERVVGKIKDILNNRTCGTYFVRGTYTRFNLDFSEDVIHIADLGFKSLSIEPVVAAPNAPYAIQEEDLDVISREYDRLLDECVNRLGRPDEFDFYHFKVSLDQGPCVYKRLAGCGAGYQYMAVTPEGNLYPCHQFVGEEGFEMGNIWDGVLKPQLREMFANSHVYTKDNCADCWARFYCSGGCHASSYKAAGSINANYRIGCEIEKKRLECAIALEVIRRMGEKEVDRCV
jgi:uncharacterized protein